MKSEQTAPTANFPSDEFLKKYFGADTALAFNPLRGEIATNLYGEIRRRIEYVLRDVPVHMLKCQNHAQTTVTPVFVFQAGELIEWARHGLECDGILPLFSNAIAELCLEFSQHCLQPHVQTGRWWRWQVAGSSIWVEADPEAVALGKNKRRTFAEILGQ